MVKFQIFLNSILAGNASRMRSGPICSFRLLVRNLDQYFKGLPLISSSCTLHKKCSLGCLEWICKFSAHLEFICLGFSS
ncbi:hypothetical protein RchiOBHm_Chr4g0408631 [Rosa chinensis]|uniref:Uncharacterized protein n=1 Tax=Rosa chinensis TaxID=74649 RepID=A0A2P6QUW0_ROSCH|nr:hypothetical protein RchiOBHm_Chr4g0408631 [Rosa chinensis]